MDHRSYIPRPVDTSEVRLPEELQELAEKSYDRNTAIETLKLILKLGFKIGK